MAYSPVVAGAYHGVSRAIAGHGAFDAHRDPPRGGSVGPENGSDGFGRGIRQIAPNPFTGYLDGDSGIERARFGAPHLLAGPIHRSTENQNPSGGQRKRLQMSHQVAVDVLSTSEEGVARILLRIGLPVVPLEPDPNRRGRPDVR